MRLLPVAIVLMLAACAHSRVAIEPFRNPALPDPRLTPGAIDPSVTQANISATICIRGYTRTVRPPPRMTSVLKREQLAARHLPGTMRDYEEDHLIPLELGGAPADERNLWPEARGGEWAANAKDRLENRLHALVCARSLDLATAQRAIARDWIAAYDAYMSR